MNQVTLDLFETAGHKPGGSPNAVALGPNARENLNGKSRTGGPGSATEEVVLGELVWYSVSDAVRLTPDILKASIEAAGLEPKKLMPQAPTPPSALSRAADAAEVKGRRLLKGRAGETVYEDLYANVLLRSAARGVKQVVTEVLDAANARLSYRPVATVSPGYTNGRPDGTIQVERRPQDGDVPDEELLEAELDAISNLKTYYDFEKSRHDGEAARRVLGRILFEANAVPLRNSGGMYFVPRGHNAAAGSILDFIEEVRVRAESAPTRTPRASMSMKVPLVDREEYREVLAESVEYFVQKEAKSLIHEMSELLKSEKTVSVKRGKAFVERVRTLRENVGEYEELLEMQATEARAKLDIAAREAKALLRSIQPQSPDS